MPALRLNTVEDVPWSPHVGLRLLCRRSLEALKVLQHSAPKALPLPVFGPLSEGERDQDWKSHLQRSRRQSSRLLHLPKDADNIALAANLTATEHLGTQRDSIELGMQLENWARASEQWTVNRAGGLTKAKARVGIAW